MHRRSSCSAAAPFREPPHPAGPRAAVRGFPRGAWHHRGVTDDLVTRVPALLRASGHVEAVELGGSRARGTATRLSDWDFVVDTDDFASLADDLPRLVAPLEPLVAQWDPLSDYECYMLVLPGPVKVDLIFADVPHEDAPPWEVSPTTLQRIDDHLWDWLLWLASKVASGREERVEAELAKLHRHLLAPMGVERVPRSLGEAVDRYLAARDRWEARFDTAVDRRAEREVLPVVRSVGRG